MQHIHKSVLLLALATTLLTACATHASPGAWTKLGERSVSDRVDHDVISVGADQGRFSKVQLRSTQGKVRVRRVVVHFGDGSRQELERDLILRSGFGSPVVDLEGDRRVIRRVELTYDEASPLRRRAKVQLWARH